MGDAGYGNHTVDPKVAGGTPPGAGSRDDPPTESASGVPAGARSVPPQGTSGKPRVPTDASAAPRTGGSASATPGAGVMPDEAQGDEVDPGAG